MARWALLTFVLLFLGACGGPASGEGRFGEQAPERDDVFDESSARSDAVSELAGTTYEEAGAPLGCTDDCGGHEAGFAWAQENQVEDKVDCSGNGSFNEGCEAYVDELDRLVEEARERAATEADDSSE